MKEWYRIEAYNEKKDFMGKNRITFEACLDLNDWYDVRICREVAGNKLHSESDIVVLFKPM